MKKVFTLALLAAFTCANVSFAQDATKPAKADKKEAKMDKKDDKGKMKKGDKKDAKMDKKDEKAK